MASIELEKENYELDILLRVLKDHYQKNYLDYRIAYIMRRVHRNMELMGYQTITELTNAILHSRKIGEDFINDLAINVTDMFRCPEFFHSLIQEVFPLLKTYPSIRIWHAGCSSGEEVLSLAILLKEHDLYHKCKIIGTDSNEDVLKMAQRAIYPISKIKEWTKNYTDSGGNSSFAQYYNVKYNYVVFDSELLTNVEYYQHDLTTTDYPKNFHLIICRNVLIYFDDKLQKHVISGFWKSLRKEGYLGLGEKEHILFAKSGFRTINHQTRIYQKNE